MDNQVTVQELLAFKLLRKAVIAAGWAGCGNHVAGIIEFQANQQHMSNCLVLIQGSEYSGEAASSALTACLESSVAGVLFGGEYAAITDGIITAADQKGIPIAVLPGKASPRVIASFLDLAVELKREGNLESYIEGMNFEEYYRHIQKGVPAVLSDLRSYTANPVALVSTSFEIVAWDGDQGQPMPFLDKWIKSIYIKDYHRKNRETKSDVIMPLAQGSFTRQDGQPADYFAVSLSFKGMEYGYLLIFETQRKVSRMDLLRLRQAGLICLQELVSHKQQQDMEDKYKSQFVYDLLYNNFDSADTLVQRATFWGWNFSRAYQLFVVDSCTGRSATGNDEECLLPVLSAVSSVLRLNCKAAIACELMGKIVVIFPDMATKEKDRKNNVLDISSKIQQYVHAKMPEVCLTFGVGRFYPAAAELCRSYQEAKQALEFGRFVNNGSFITFFEDLGAVRLLANVSWELMDDYYKEYLNALVEYDEKNGASLLDTLQVYFQQNADLNQTAEKLFMHSNTLRYRLKKIEEILDTDLQRLDNRLNLYLACKIAKIREASL